MSQIIKLAHIGHGASHPKKETVSSVEMLRKSFATLCESAARQGVTAFVVMAPAARANELPEEVKNSAVTGMYKMAMNNPSFAEIIEAVALQMSKDKIDALLEERGKTIIPKISNS